MLSIFNSMLNTVMCAGLLVDSILFAGWWATTCCFAATFSRLICYVRIRKFDQEARTADLAVVRCAVDFLNVSFSYNSDGIVTPGINVVTAGIEVKNLTFSEQVGEWRLTPKASESIFVDF